MEKVSHQKKAGGFTLVELMVTTSVMAILITYSVPKFRNAFEQARVNLAAANLQAVWTAQRLYWAEHGEYATTLTLLEDDELLDPVFVNTSDVDTNPEIRFGFTMATTAEGFLATATRNPLTTTIWSGVVTIDQDGAIDGQIDNSHDATVILPSANF